MVEQPDNQQTEELLHKLLDEIGDSLRDQGLTLDDMMERGRHIRGELLKEQYAINVPSDVLTDN